MYQKSRQSAGCGDASFIGWHNDGIADSFAEKKHCPRRSIMIQLGTGYCIYYALLDVDLIKFCDSVGYHIYRKRKRKQQIENNARSKNK